MARKEREIIIKIIENKKVYDKMLIDFFAKKYDEKIVKEKCKKKDIL